MHVHLAFGMGPPILKWSQRIQRLPAYVTADMFFGHFGPEPVTVHRFRALLHLNTPKLAGMLRTRKAPSTSSSLMIREKIFVFMFYLQDIIDDFIDSNAVNFIIQQDGERGPKQIMSYHDIMLNMLGPGLALTRSIDPDYIRMILFINYNGRETILGVVIDHLSSLPSCHALILQGGSYLAVLDDGAELIRRGLLPGLL